MSKFIITGSIVLALLWMTGCSRNDAQQEFEQEAYTLPRNYTETTFQGEVVTTDEDDWRTSPLFQGLVSIIPPYPNPTGTDQVIKLGIEVTGVQSVQGFEVLTRFEDGSFRSLYQTPEGLEPGFTEYQLNPLEFAQFGNVEGARGLNRIYIFDGRQQMISYGDILIE